MLNPISTTQPQKGGNCELCDGQGIRHHYTVNGQDYGVRESRIFAFKRDFPDAFYVGVVVCQCSEEKRMQQIVGSAGVPKRRRHCTFAEFDAFPDEWKREKTEARELCQLMADGNPILRDGFERAGLTLAGLTGMGKSGLMAATVMGIMARGIPVLWVDFEEFLDAIKTTYEDDSEHSTSDVVAAAQHAPVLALDDFGDMKRDKPVTDHTREKTYAVIRYRYENELPTIITTNLSVQQMYDQFGSRITDRIGEMNHWIPMKGINLRFGK